MNPVIVKANLAHEKGRWFAGVSSRVMGLAPGQVIASGATPHEAITALTDQLTQLLGIPVILLLETTP